MVDNSTVSMRSRLRNGQEIPFVGCMLCFYNANIADLTLSPSFILVGTYLMKDKQVISSVLDAAVQSGYRMVGKWSVCAPWNVV